MKLIIVEAPGNTLVAEVDDYTGPIPRPGEYIVHPPRGGEEQPGLIQNVMGVKTITYGILARPEPGVDHFVGRSEPYIEIRV